jgi:hypothetical protein
MSFLVYVRSVEGSHLSFDDPAWVDFTRPSRRLPAFDEEVKHTFKGLRFSLDLHRTTYFFFSYPLALLQVFRTEQRSGADDEPVRALFVNSPTSKALFSTVELA